MLVAHDAVLGFLEGARDFKARSTAKEHTSEVQNSCRDPGVSRQLCGRPLDMGKRCVAVFSHGALNWQETHFHHTLGCRLCLLVPSSTNYAC